MNITSQPPLIQSSSTSKLNNVESNQTNSKSEQISTDNINETTEAFDRIPPPIKTYTWGGDMQPPPMIQEETFTYSRTPTGLAGPTVESNSDVQEPTQPNVRVLLTA